MKRMAWVFAIGCAMSLSVGALSAQDADRIWGRVLTTTGDEIEGFIRWDRNEANWADLFDGSKDIDWTAIEDWEVALGEREDEHQRSIEFMGVRVSWDDDDRSFPTTASSGIRFGHIERLTVTGRQRALLRLRSGEDVEFNGGSTDLGTDMRELLIESRDQGTIELEWRDLDEIEFFEAPPSARPEATRLYGTVQDRWGNAYSGYISWDLDEVLTSDILDGDEDGKDREIEFASIASIERLGRRASIVTFRDGGEVELSGSNDVARGNRGIQISDPELGQVEVEWDEFSSIRFHGAEARARLAHFDGGHRLRGTVTTESGVQHTGTIRWDADETYSWEFLNGELDDIIFEIEFGKIASIEKVSWHSSNVTLRDGRAFQLENSNDVDEDNRGIFLETDSGRKIVIDWIDFASVSFQRN